MRHSFATIPSSVSREKNQTVSRVMRACARLTCMPVAYRRMPLALALALLIVPLGMAQAPAKRPAAPAQKKPSSRSASAVPETVDVKKATEPDPDWLQNLLKNRELMAELGTLANKLKAGVQYPAPRSQSRILGLLPESTILYTALPNYGDSIHQALQIFQQELSQSAPLRDFLQKNKLDAVEPKLEQGVQRFYEVTQYLGDEVVIAGGLKGQEPSGVVIAEIKKPGLRELLEKLNNEQFPNKSSRLRIFDPQQLASATEPDGADGPAVLVRNDLLVLGTVASLREFNSQVEQGGSKLVSAPLGQKLAQSYQSGAGTLLAVDLQKMIGLMPPNKIQERMMLEKSGFSDVLYLVGENKLVNGTSTNHAELTFTGPRRGIASWIAASGPLGAMDFFSSAAASVVDMRLKSPVLIFDDLREIAGDAAFASLPQMEEQLGVNLKQDVLSKLTGEIAFETKLPPETFSGAASGAPEGTMHATKAPSIKIILGVSDPVGLQQTLARLLAVAPVQGGQRQEDGVTINTLAIPSPGAPSEINYFFLDGYLIIASDRAGASEALHAHRAGDSLAKSAKLREALQASGQQANASVLAYQNASQLFMPLLAQLSPEMRQFMPSSEDTKPSVFSLVADEHAFRGTMNSSVQTSMSMLLVGAAVAIPNLMRSRNEPNELAAVSAVRSVNMAEVTYATVYRAKGYAPSLAMLGPPANGDCSGNGTSGHACLLDQMLGNAACTAGKWCEKSGYRFSVRGICGQTANCKGYVVTATPISAGTGKSFCSVSDAVIRMHTGAPLEAPLTAAECKTWPAIQ